MAGINWWQVGPAILCGGLGRGCFHTDRELVVQSYPTSRVYCRIRSVLYPPSTRPWNLSLGNGEN